MKTDRLTKERLDELLDYDPDTGEFRWRVSRGPRKAGAVAGGPHQTGYAVIRIDSVQYLTHRLAWLTTYGEFPPEQTDHINHDRSDNRISNLRAVSNAENALNQKIAKNNTSGSVGVYWYPKIGKWVAAIRVRQKYIHLGCFAEKEDAISARKAAEEEHNFHPNHGKLNA